MIPLIDETALETYLSAAKLVQLADDDRDGVADVAVITEVSAKATALINDTLQPRYGSYVPFLPETCPPVLISLALDIAGFELYARRNNVPQVVQYRYELALQRLKDYAAGRMPLVVASSPLAVTADDIVSSTCYADRVFTRETLYQLGRGPQ